MFSSEAPPTALKTFGVHGAYTLRRLHAAHPEDTALQGWEELLNLGHLRIYHTLYGQVLGLTDTGRALARRTDTSVVYLSAPSSVANRAYQNDALLLLFREGYGYGLDAWQTRGAPRKQGPRKHTDEIIRHCLRLPPAAMQRASELPYFGSHSVLSRPWHRVGQPSLYATISNGGITRDQAQQYLRRHSSAMRAWRAPLHLAVPDPARLECLCSWNTPRSLPYGHPSVRLIHLPVPEL